MVIVKFYVTHLRVVRRIPRYETRALIACGVWLIWGACAVRDEGASVSVSACGSKALYTHPRAAIYLSYVHSRPDDDTLVDTSFRPSAPSHRKFIHHPRSRIAG